VIDSKEKKNGLIGAVVFVLGLLLTLSLYRFGTDTWYMFIIQWGIRVAAIIGGFVAMIKLNPPKLK